MCDLVRKSEGGGHVCSFERRGPLARGAMFLLSRGGVHWIGGSIGIWGGGVRQNEPIRNCLKIQMGVSTPTNFKNDP